MSDESAGDRRLMIVAVLASFVAFLDGSVVTLALPAIGADFGGGLRLQQWVFDGYLLLLGALILLAGAVSDSIGRLRVLRGGIVVFGLGSMLCAVAPNGAVLVAARCLQGLGAAFLVPSSLAMINGRFTGDRQAKAIGRWTGWTGTAFVVGPVLGGVLVDTVGWRWIFAINLLPLAVTFYLSTRLTRDDVVRPARPGGIDVVGAVLTITGLTGVVVGLIEQQRLGMTSPLVLSALTVGVLCLVAFPWWEERAENPMMPLHLFASRNFAVGNAATVFLYAGLSLSTLVVTLFLQETVGLSATLAGLATLAMPISSILLAARFGVLAGRFGPRWFMAVGPLVSAAGFLSMLRVRSDFNFWLQLLPGLVLFAVGLAATVSPLTVAVLSAVDPTESGIESAVNNAVARVSGLIAVAFVSVIVGGAINESGFRRGVTVTAVLFALSGLVSAIGIRNDRAGPGGGATRRRCELGGRDRRQDQGPQLALDLGGGNEQ
jgi:EmrB/QacA subfamily drug resistance transporter